MVSVLQDLRYGARLLLRSPGFSLVAIMALAIGIGANTAIFSVINTLLLQPLPYRDADRLAIVWEHNLPRDRRSNVVGPANFIHWREMNRVFEDLAAVTFTYSVTVTGNGDPEELQAQSISAELFQILGVQPALGRGFTAAENVPGARSIVISDRLWKRRFGSDRAILEKPIVSQGIRLHGRRRHAARLLVSRQERRRLAADRVHRAVADSSRAIADGRRPSEARGHRRTRAARHDAGLCTT